MATVLPARVTFASPRDAPCASTGAVMARQEERSAIRFSILEPPWNPPAILVPAGRSKQLAGPGGLEKADAEPHEPRGPVERMQESRGRGEEGGHRPGAEGQERAVDPQDGS